MPEYRAPRFLEGPHLQSLLASLPLRDAWVRREVQPQLGASVAEIIDCGAGVRLLCRHTPPPRGPGRMAVLIHGWEGSAESVYMLSAAHRLHREGYRVVRLNLRDHGGSQHLNEGLFHSCRLAEVQDAVAALQRRFPDERLFLGGFSLGGNFALRVAAAAAGTGLRIERVVAVCPVLDPRSTLRALDDGLPHYRWYFLRRWRRSLERKRAAFPGLYDFGRLRRFRTLEAMTEYFACRYAAFPDLETYLRGYAITGERLAGLAVPAEILLAEDDPVIPVRDAHALARPPALRIRRTLHGGHCAFIADYRLRSWLDGYLAQAFAAGGEVGQSSR
ncbi:MAG: alpha/beta fold hydrolase [Gammaproteobacteria bacterium]|nr:alpha/beta fold hydrolase [Gammaproteobacteria bacterium]